MFILVSENAWPHDRSGARSDKTTPSASSAYVYDLEVRAGGRLGAAAGHQVQVSGE